MATAAKASTSPVMYPHIVKEEGYCGGDPAIDNTRVRVADVAHQHVQGKSDADIMEWYPDISLAQLHAALAYYYDNRDEIETIWREDDEASTKAIAAQEARQAIR